MSPSSVLRLIRLTWFDNASSVPERETIVLAPAKIFCLEESDARPMAVLVERLYADTCQGGLAQTAKARCQAEQSTIIMPARSAEFDFAAELKELRNSAEGKSVVPRKVLIHYPDLQITLRVMKTQSCIPELQSRPHLCANDSRTHSNACR